MVLAVIGIGCVSAVDLGGFFFSGGESQTVYLDGVEFNIPAGYEEDTSLYEEGVVDDYSTFTATAYQRSYDSGSSYITIRVVEYDGTYVDDVLTNYMDGRPEDINGVEGFLYSDGFGYTYTYQDGNRVVSIQSDREDTIADVLVP